MKFDVPGLKNDASDVLSAKEAYMGVQLLKCLTSPVRLGIIAMLVEHDECTMCVNDIAEQFELAQPTISHHLRVLAQAGIIYPTKRTTYVYYSVDRSRLSQCIAIQRKVFDL